MKTQAGKFMACVAAVLLVQQAAVAMTLKVTGNPVRNGDVAIVDTGVVPVQVTTTAAGVAGVMVQRVEGIFNPADGTWTVPIGLAAGLNTVTAEALDATGKVVDAGTLDIVYVPPANHPAGVMDANTVWSGACLLDGAVTVPAGKVLTVQPGTWVLMKDNGRIDVSGQILARGTEDKPIYFTHYGDAAKWKQIMIVDANDSVFQHCTFEYANCAGAHQDYYDPNVPRNYHEALTVLASHVDFNDCVFRKLMNASGATEGDAMAIISDDMYHPGPASAHIWGCRFVSVGQGIHTRYAYVLVEDCYFQGKTGDNDDVDLYGESDPPCLIRRNLFDVPEHDDRINPTLCSVIITDNIIMGSTDHGLVLRDRSSPVVMNNIIMNCSSGGIAVENSCTALIVNNTIYNCARGLRLFDLGRWDAPYRLHPGGGTATVINCVIWNCPQPATLADSSNTTIADRGSHLTMQYCDVSGGKAAISVSGKYSTVTWGSGNITADPLFADAAQADFHFKSQGGRWDPNSVAWVNDSVTSPCIDAGDPNSPVGDEPIPNGARINMGAYGGTAEASKSPGI